MLLLKMAQETSPLSNLFKVVKHSTMTKVNVSDIEKILFQVSVTQRRKYNKNIQMFMSFITDSYAVSSAAWTV